MTTLPLAAKLGVFLAGQLLVAVGVTLEGRTAVLFRGQWGRKFRHAPLFTTLVMLTSRTCVGGFASVVAGGIVMIVAFLGDPGVAWWQAAGLVAVEGVGAFIYYRWARKEATSGVRALGPAPRLHTGDPVFDAGFVRVYELLDLNLAAPMGKLATRWASPGPKYPGCYLWDSAFIALVWKYWDPAIAVEILQPFVDLQAWDPGTPAEHGRVPQMVALGRWPTWMTNPPLLAWALAEIRALAGPAPFLDTFIDRACERLPAYHAWLARNRGKEGLYYWRHSYESGLDNSPRFTNVSESEQEDLTDVAAVDLTSFVALQLQSLARLADARGDAEATAQYRAEYENLARRARERLWSAEDGLFYDRRYATGEHVRLNTIASFFPLLAGIPTPAQVQALVAHLTNPLEYATPIPLPTVARDSPAFMKDTWRGPPWVNTAYAVLHGLAELGRREDAQGTGEMVEGDVGRLAGEMAFQLVKGVFETYQNCGSFYEFYDPDRPDLEELTRKKGNFWKQVTLGGKPVAKFVGWTGLVNTLLIELVVGYSRDADGTVHLHPHLPAEWQGRTITLELPFFHDRVTLTLGAGDRVEYRVDHLPGNIAVQADPVIEHHDSTPAPRAGSGLNHQRLC